MNYNINEYIKGIESQSIKHLAKAITLSESNKPDDKIANEQIINYFFDKIYKSNKNQNNSINFSKKIGITGSPGVGKSTFIETLGLDLCNAGSKVAVLAIDPSSNITKGSILGDKTRMNNLSVHKNAFVRPSPTSGFLGGVNSKTQEAILLCQAAGFEYIIIETVGVGQSEIEVRNLVDFFILLILPGGGDELQGIKKGIVEMSDLLLINKADNQNLQNAKITMSEYKSILDMIKTTKSGYKRQIQFCSALEKTNIDKVIKTIDEFYEDNEIIEYLKNNDFIKNWANSLFLNQMLDKAKIIWENNYNELDFELSPYEIVNLLNHKINLNK